MNHRPQLEKGKKSQKQVEKKSNMWLLALADYWSQEKSKKNVKKGRKKVNHRPQLEKCKKQSKKGEKKKNKSKKFKHMSKRVEKRSKKVGSGQIDLFFDFLNFSDLLFFDFDFWDRLFLTFLKFRKHALSNESFFYNRRRC